MPHTPADIQSDAATSSPAVYEASMFTVTAATAHVSWNVRVTIRLTSNTLARARISPIRSVASTTATAVGRPSLTLSLLLSQALAADDSYSFNLKSGSVNKYRGSLDRTSDKYIRR